MKSSAEVILGNDCDACNGTGAHADLGNTSLEMCIERCSTCNGTGKCEHIWKWWPIAGEGRYCVKCGKRDFDCDD